MKYDFDHYQENIYNLDLATLSEFNINKKIIMTPMNNQLEEQILLKLYKLLKPDIDSSSFK